MLLGKGDHALWSSSCVRRKPEGHLLALLYERDGEREEGEGEDVGGGRRRCLMR